MIDFILIAQFVVLFMNVMVFIYLMNEPEVKYRRVRVMLLICISIGIIINIGKVTWFTVLFSFTPFLSLININENGKIYRFIKRVRGNLRSNQQRLQNIQRHSETVSKEA